MTVLREAEELGALLREALSTAPEDERPGLERAVALVERAAAVPDSEVRGRWVRQRLAAAGYEGPADAVAAVRILRTAEPGLRACRVTSDRAATARHARFPRCRKARVAPLRGPSSALESHAPDRVRFPTPGHPTGSEPSGGGDLHQGGGRPVRRPHRARRAGCGAIRAGEGVTG